MDSGLGYASASVGPAGSAIYFDGMSSRRRLVILAFKDQLELHEPSETTVKWSYADIRRPGIFSSSWAQRAASRQS
jgi:hypothetical protein